MNPGRRYQWILVGLLSANFGIVFFDRNAINVLMPFIQPELGISNSAIGALASALSLSWAIAGLCVGRLSDFLGKRKIVLIIASLLFSAASVISGIAGSFAMLLAARLLMGLAEGGVMPISQALVVAEVEPQRRGLAMGAAQNVGANLLGNFLAPVILVAFASAQGWRHAFFLAAAPGLAISLLMAWLIREPVQDRGAQRRTGPIRDVLRLRNVWLCIVLSILLVAFLLVFAAFMPVYLVQVLRMDKTTMSWLMSMWGLPSIAYAFLVTGASDRIGRRLVVISMGAISALIPLGVLVNPAGAWVLFILFGLAAAVSGIYPIVMATIPAETVSPSRVATVMGLTMGLGEVVGGVLSPGLAGLLADRFGLTAIVWVLLAISLGIVVASFGLEETAPIILQNRRIQSG
jgi:predicted MFS family arabinose efflux permease